MKLKNEQFAADLPALIWLFPRPLLSSFNPEKGGIQSIEAL
jgi:hypothetical protein